MIWAGQTTLWASFESRTRARGEKAKYIAANNEIDHTLPKAEVIAEGCHKLGSMAAFINHLVGTLAYFGPSVVPALRASGLVGTSVHQRAPTTIVATAEGSFPKLHIDHTYGIENEYQLNLGRAIDTLRRDYPSMLRDEPDFSIFSPNIRLCDKDRCLEGLTAYTRVFDVLRFMRNTTMVHDEIGTRVVVEDGTIRVRWNARLTMSTPFGSLPFINNRDEAGRPIVFVDGVSAYEVNETGFIFSHRLEDVEVTPPELQGAVDLALFAWPGGFTPPVAAVPSLFTPTTDALAFSVGSGGLRLSEDQMEPNVARAATTPPLRRRSAELRAPAPLATAGETPMERAARERAEDAEMVAQRRRGAKGGGANLFSNLLNTVAPQQCESNYDCEAPLVCCDLIVASVCCSSGMMIGPPQRAVPQMQRQEIPVPVPVDDDNFPPRGGAYGPGNGFPSPP